MAQTEQNQNRYQDWILETIDSLRARKARPDLERICRMVRRKHGSNPNKTREELDKLIQSQNVLKVSYKGSISYRNAAKVLSKSRKKSEFSSSIDEKSKDVNNSDSFTDQDQGASSSSNQPHTPLDSACDDEASPGAAPLENQGPVAPRSPPSRAGLTKVTHCGGRAPHTGEQAPPGVRGPNNTSVPSQTHTMSPQPEVPSDALSVRGPSVTHFDHDKGLPCEEEERLTCEEEERLTCEEEERLTCEEEERLTCEEEERLTCEEEPPRAKVRVVDGAVARGPRGLRGLRGLRCGNITLPLDAAHERSVEGKKNDPTQITFVDERWQDPNEEQMEENVSQSCGEYLRSPVAMATESETEDAAVQSTSKHLTKDLPCSDPGTSCLLTPTASPTDSGLDEPGMFSVESLSPMDWSVSDVVSYFTTVGFSEQAAAFRTQEIDGKALLLMQRNDVLTGLSIKLGPALKIYEHHVKVLQKIHFKEEEL